jgi:hypothetical protein
MPTGITDADWDDILRRIHNHKCTPFIGAGAAAATLPLAGDLALKWARQFGYPLSDATNLARVAQYIVVERDDAMKPKELMQEEIDRASPPDFAAPDEPHGVLADLELPIYITTNYDGLMFSALADRRKDPRREICGWNPVVAERRPSLLDTGFVPTPANPLVYHLHGFSEEPQSMVLTEDDYLQFLVRISMDNSVRLLPSAIRTALGGTSLLFVGYSLADWDFRVLFRGLIGSLGSTLGYPSIAVQLDPSSAEDPAETRERAQRYLNGYFQKIQRIKVRLFWGDVRDFSRELRQRWEAFEPDG